MKQKSFLLLLCCSMVCTSPLPLAKHKLVMIAHRANHEHFPENSLAAIREAINCGADYAEIDLRTTRDGYLVLSHDASLQRMTGVPLKVNEVTWDSLKSFSLRGAPSKDPDAQHVPLFRDVLASCHGKINIYLDFKEADVKETYRQIRAAGMEHQIVVYLNKPEQYGQWKEIAPDMPLMSSLPDSVSTPESIDAFFRATPLEVFDNITDPSLLAAVHRHGAKVWLDVQSADEGPDTWSKALKLGIDGLQTDHPTFLARYLKR